MSREPLIRHCSLAVIVAGTLAISLSSAALAAEPVTPQSSGPAHVPAPARPLPNLPENAEEIQAVQGKAPAGAIVTRRPARVLTPMMAEIMAFLETHDQALAARRQQLATHKNDRAAAATLQQEIRRMKMDGEIEVLRIQARHAAKEGRVADARRLEESIEERLNPKVRIAPEQRPVPQPSTNR